MNYSVNSQIGSLTGRVEEILKAQNSLAADYTADTIRETLKNPDKPWYGVDFEATIPELVKMLAEKLEK